MPPLQSKKRKASPVQSSRSHPFKSVTASHSRTNSNDSSIRAESSSSYKSSSYSLFSSSIPPAKTSNERSWKEAWQLLGNQSILPLGPLWLTCVNDIPPTAKLSIEQKVALRRSVLQSCQQMRHIGEFLQSASTFTNEHQQAMWHRFQEELEMLHSPKWRDKLSRVLTNANVWTNPIWKGTVFEDRMDSILMEGFTIENVPIPQMIDVRKLKFTKTCKESEAMQALWRKGSCPMIVQNAEGHRSAAVEKMLAWAQYLLRSKMCAVASISNGWQVYAIGGRQLSGCDADLSLLTGRQSYTMWKTLKFLFIVTPEEKPTPAPPPVQRFGWPTVSFALHQEQEGQKFLQELDRRVQDVLIPFAMRIACVDPWRSSLFPAPAKIQVVQDSVVDYDQFLTGNFQSQFTTRQTSDFDLNEVSELLQGASNRRGIRLTRRELDLAWQWTHLAALDRETEK